MSKRKIIAITISLPLEQHEILVNIAAKNKIENAKFSLRGDKRKPDTISTLISFAIEKTFEK